MFCVLFSSRRRHTRCLSDWSSDVCSSDLGNDKPGRDCCEGLSRREFVRAVGVAALATAAPGVTVAAEKAGPTPKAAAETAEIGRASGREGGYESDGREQ